MRQCIKDGLSIIVFTCVYCLLKHKHWNGFTFIWCYINEYLEVGEHKWISLCRPLPMAHVTLVAIIGTTILVCYLIAKSLQLIWKSGIPRFHLRVPDLRMSCRHIMTACHECLPGNMPIGIPVDDVISIWLIATSLFDSISCTRNIMTFSTFQCHMQHR